MRLTRKQASAASDANGAHLIMACRALALLSVGLLLAFGASAQQTYPTRPLRLIVPFPPGGGNDFVGRLVAQRLSERIRQQIIVDNRPGASGIIGTEMAARAAPDGYTLL